MSRTALFEDSANRLIAARQNYLNIIDKLDIADEKELNALTHRRAVAFEDYNRAFKELSIKVRMDLEP